MDNFEWTGGYGTRFGLVYGDFKPQKRFPKLSVNWFHGASRRNAVSNEAERSPRRATHDLQTILVDLWHRTFVQYKRTRMRRRCIAIYRSNHR